MNKITSDDLYEEIESAADRAAPLFRLYGWTYGGVGTPSHNDLVETITRITDSAIESFYDSKESYRQSEVSSGRFNVTLCEYEDEIVANISLELGEKSWSKQ